MTNPAREALTRAVNRAMAEGAPRYVEQPAVREFAFDCTLTTAIRVKAATEADARAMLRAEIDSADANLGAWPNGDPILCEVSLAAGPVDLYEVDGEDVTSDGDGLWEVSGPEAGDGDDTVVLMFDGQEQLFVGKSGDDVADRMEAGRAICALLNWADVTR